VSADVRVHRACMELRLQDQNRDEMYLPTSVGVQANFVLSVVHNSPVSAAVMSRMMLALLDNERSREVHIFGLMHPGEQEILRVCVPTWAMYIVEPCLRQPSRWDHDQVLTDNLGSNVARATSAPRSERESLHADKAWLHG
jgi:hypothetical protein